MAGFIGEYECKLDAKGRFMLPAGLRKQLDPAAKEQFVMNRGFEGCLNLFPINEWEKETARFEDLNLYIAKNRRFYRQFHNGATQLGLDGAGRVLIPKQLAKAGGIEKEIVLNAMGNRIEVWSKSRFEEEMGDNDDFEALAEDVMGSLNQPKNDHD